MSHEVLSEHEKETGHNLVLVLHQIQRCSRTVKETCYFEAFNYYEARADGFDESKFRAILPIMHVGLQRHKSRDSVR